MVSFAFSMPSRTINLTTMWVSGLMVTMVRESLTSWNTSTTASRLPPVMMHCVVCLKRLKSLTHLMRSTTLVLITKSCFLLPTGWNVPRLILASSTLKQATIIPQTRRRLSSMSSGMSSTASVVSISSISLWHKILKSRWLRKESLRLSRSALPRKVAIGTTQAWLPTS